ncbi:MAG: DNA helicase RecQ [Planctomycetota bacterium]|nr:DNA helicase RecQ [Planctomycetota bacterium]
MQSNPNEPPYSDPGFPGSSDPELDPQLDLSADELSNLWSDEGGGGSGVESGGWQGGAQMVQDVLPWDAAQAIEDLGPTIQRTWGFDELRPLQAEAMHAFLEGKNTLVVLPTGGGKSLCYQAPALVRPGFTLVVSPLIALMKDQLDGLTAHGVPAGMLTSAQDAEERRDVLRRLFRGDLKLLFCSPERLMMDGFYGRLVEAGLSAIAVDEAHCISHWGHDFRPEYSMLGELRRQAGGVPLLALTATATPRVQQDIMAELGLEDADLMVGNFDRPNLTYRIAPRTNLIDQIQGVLDRHEGGAGIVYALRRKDVDSIAGELAAKGLRVQPYHAGMDSARRRTVQESFQNESTDIVVATVAFGMGIDRPDVRFVIHASLPKGVEQYSQETGRAGRDGLPSECILFYSGSDYHGWRNLMERSSQESELAGQIGAKDELDASLERLGELWSFAGGAACRHRFLVEYFGGDYPTQKADGGCGACDVCLGELNMVEDAAVIAQKILSCVVRTQQRYGAGHVTDVLRGADTAKIRQTGHNELTTFGLLKEFERSDVRTFIDQLVSSGFLAVAPGPYPTLHLTQDGLAAMKGESEVSLFRPKRAKARARGAGRKAATAALEEAGLPVDQGLFEALRSMRRKEANERNVPPYILFSDRTLAALAAHKPKDRTSLLAIKGIGEKKATDLGPLVLKTIAEFE